MSWPVIFVVILGAVGWLLLAVAWFFRGRLVGPFARFVLSALSLLAAFTTGTSLLMAAALKTNSFADKLLSYYPRYALAEDGFNTLKDRKYPLQVAPDQTQNVGVLSIDEPGWGVLLDFVRSETAIRKSERNEPSSLHSLPSPPSTASPSPPIGSTSPSAPTSSPLATDTSPAQIDYERIKTIINVERPVISAGPKPLIPPYALIVLWPTEPPTAHRVYEFVTFEEFHLDLKHMMLDEMEGWSLWIGVIAFAVASFAEGVRRIATWGGGMIRAPSGTTHENPKTQRP